MQAKEQIKLKNTPKTNSAIRLPEADCTGGKSLRNGQH